MSKKNYVHEATMKNMAKEVGITRVSAVSAELLSVIATTLIEDLLDLVTTCRLDLNMKNKDGVEQGLVDADTGKLRVYEISDCLRNDADWYKLIN